MGDLIRDTAVTTAPESGLPGRSNFTLQTPDTHMACVSFFGYCSMLESEDSSLAWALRSGLIGWFRKTRLSGRSQISDVLAI